MFRSLHSASARISKGQGYQGLIWRKRAGSSFGQKRAICVVQAYKEKPEKQNFNPFTRVNKMFSHKF
jgi:hypothetical protein